MGKFDRWLDRAFIVAVYLCLAGCSEPSVSSASMSDAGGDADGGAASPAAFCANAPAGTFYCNDFDEDAEVAGMASTVVDGTLAVDDAVFVSPPHSLHATSMVDAGSTTSAFVQAVTDRSPKRVSISFELRGAFPDNTFYIVTEIIVAEVGALRLNATNGEFIVDEEMRLESGTETVDLHGPQAAALSDGAWHQVSLTLDMSTSPAQVISSFDGSIHTDPAQLLWTPGVISVQYGLGQRSGPVSAADIDIDNVLVTGD